MDPTAQSVRYGGAKQCHEVYQHFVVRNQWATPSSFAKGVEVADFCYIHKIGTHSPSVPAVFKKAVNISPLLLLPQSSHKSLQST